MMKQLPTPTMVAWVGMSAVFMYLSVCFSTLYLKSNAASARIIKLDTLWILETRLFCGQRSRSQCRKTLPAWVMAILWVLASSSITESVNSSFTLQYKPNPLVTRASDSRFPRHCAHYYKVDYYYYYFDHRHDHKR